MFRKTILVFLVMGAAVIFLSSRQLFAQRQPDGQEALYMISEKLAAMEAKLDKIVVLMDKVSNKEVLQKLDQVLDNQGRIINELDVVRVRASKK